MTRVLYPLALCGMVLVCITALAQGQTPQPPPQPTFESAVTLVTSDLIVRDRRGQFHANLTKDDVDAAAASSFS
jgi:hypothetical protein